MIMILIRRFARKVKRAKRKDFMFLSLAAFLISYSGYVKSTHAQIDVSIGIFAVAIVAVVVLILKNKLEE